MEFVILDHGLVDLRAHNYYVVVAILESLKRRNIKHSTFVYRKADTAVLRATGATPFFRHYLYESARRPTARQLPALLTQVIRGAPGSLPHDPPRSEIASWRKLNRSFRTDLARLPAGTWRRDNIIVIPAICQNQIDGLVRFLVGLPHARRPYVICQLMFAPEWTPWGGDAIHGERFYRQAFEYARPLVGRSLFFTTETEELSAHYREKYAIVPSVLGVPLSVDSADFARNEKNDPTTLGYLGYSKTSRGFHLLPDAIELLRGRGCEAKFLIQVQHSGWESQVVAAVEKLQTLASVQLVMGVLDRPAYYDLLRRSDVILLPYDASHYGERGSAVLVEAVSSGRPIVSARGTWAENLIDRGEAEGELMTEFSPTALADAIERLLQRIASSTQAAAAKAPDFAQRYSGDAYVDTVLDIVRRAQAADSGTAI